MVTKVVLVLLVVAALQIIPTTQASKERIVGGNEVSIRKHPHQIALRRRGCATCTYNHSCGGNVIAEDIIATAAHCVYNRQIQDFIVVAGSENRNGNDGFVSRLRKITVHEHYNASITDNDIALLYLATPLPLGLGLVETIELAEQVPRNGAKAVVTGWGTTSEGGVGSAKLLEVEVPIVDNEQCNESYGAGRISEAMLCAGAATGGKDACQGDSGGPLVVAGKLVGIVSWGRGCARPNYPGVYASVPYLRKWILDNIKYENTVFQPDFL